MSQMVYQRESLQTLPTKEEKINNAKAPAWFIDKKLTDNFKNTQRGQITNSRYTQIGLWTRLVEELIPWEQWF